MDKEGLIRLPPPRRSKPHLRQRGPTDATDPQTTVKEPVHQLGELQLQLVKPASFRRTGLTATTCTRADGDLC